MYVLNIRVENTIHQNTKIQKLQIHFHRHLKNLGITRTLKYIIHKYNINIL